MDAETFVVQLLECRPPLSALTDRGLPSAAAQHMLDSYRFSPKFHQTRCGDALIDLAVNYNGQRVVIGMVSFLAAPIPTITGRWHVANFEADPVFVDSQSCSVEVCEYGAIADKLYNAAVSGEAFLDALILAARHRTRHYLDKDYARDASARLTTAKNCTEAAGGSAYHDFWATLVGTSAQIKV